MTSGSKVRIVGGLVIRAIGCDGQCTILLRVVNCMTQTPTDVEKAYESKNNSECHPWV